jgi:hypothetical protein
MFAVVRVGREHKHRVVSPVIAACKAVRLRADIDEKAVQVSCAASAGHQIRRETVSNLGMLTCLAFFVVEMPAGIVLAASGEHNEALLRRGPWIGSKEKIPSAWRRRIGT